jgi:hypothetical protein
MHNHFAVAPNGRLFGGRTERPASAVLLAEGCYLPMRIKMPAANAKIPMMIVGIAM